MHTSQRCHRLEKMLEKATTSYSPYLLTLVSSIDVQVITIFSAVKQIFDAIHPIFSSFLYHLPWHSWRFKEETKHRNWMEYHIFQKNLNFYFSLGWISENFFLSLSFQ